MIRILFGFVILFYSAAFLIYGAACGGRPSRWLKAGVFLELGFLIHTFFIFVEASAAHTLVPIGTFGEVLIFFAWSVAFVYVVLLRRVRQDMFGVILIPFLLLLLVPAPFMTHGHSLPASYFDDHHFLIHILSAFFAYASFTLSAVAAILYLTQAHALKSKQISNFYKQLPPLKELERFVFYTVAWGFVLLLIAIAGGAFWSKRMVGTYLVAEPKTIASLLTFGVYGFVLYLHSASIASGKRMARVVIFAFMLVLFTFVGTSFLNNQLHVGI
ncbi:MAG: hypothetical protein COV74_10800 [Candidatus Omnitrophica bacterium CG11_big_fil_rev_8_21_14_0_20_45_26]|uniref:Cytochrome c assembly protein domain-containing protein n=1 Tax=Candidatus Abzuiibacterium crystallinum TaxID=1974748 RepID=A0A2H0LL24_9BACT|nr:MAG: hypothetical protein COV74_10800 [Candidatus Omnitrophica bacterium CG11_big_fil_rev_8_21_14_0_20_45_26]PIW63846.1 MAG: hypothetical protein COW12_08010 [Candidatus Omnitrophica bacterium CG12_big_fil_rev_8_21_14_0_65_45_16]